MHNDTVFETQGITKSERILNTPNEFVKETSLYVQEVGHLISLASHKSERENVDSFLLLKISEGSGNVTVDGTSYKLYKGDSILIDCRKPYYHECDENGSWKLSWIHYYGVSAPIYYDTIMKYCSECPIFHFGLSLEETVDELLVILKDKTFAAELRSVEILQHFIHELIKKVMSLGETEKQIEWNQIRASLNHIAEEAKRFDKIDITLLCKDFNITEEICCSGFEKKFGISIENYVEQRKMTIAKEMLRFTTKSEMEIAENIGIKDMQQFVDMFQKYENYSPEDYRKSWAQWIRK